MELSVEFGLVVDHVLDVGVHLFGNVVVFVLAPTQQQIHGLDLVPFRHLIVLLAVLRQQVVLEREEEDYEHKEQLGPIFGKYVSGINQIG